MKIYDVVKKLIGEIEPAGASHIDKKRLENLKDMIQLVKELLTDIECVRYDNKDMHEDSIKEAVDSINQFYKDIGFNE